MASIKKLVEKRQSLERTLNQQEAIASRLLEIASENPLDPLATLTAKIPAKAVKDRPPRSENSGKSKDC